jgi:hypothetical protein
MFDLVLFCYLDILFYKFRFPRLDDQAVFWRIIRQSKDPHVIPIQRCRHYQPDKPGLVTCMLDTCMFSSGMISEMYKPEMTYGKEKQTFNFFSFY